MAYDYDVDILAALWTGAEDGEEPYASFIAANPDLTDEVAENRILSTIELIRSHMELLQTREEAKLLHESISKLIRHSAGGSNPWSEAAAVTDAIGNVNNPQFPAGANVEITIDGVTTSATSASGGDCKTVVAELNVPLDAGGPGVAERTDTSLVGKTASGLSGKYFTINSAGDATNYYVWYDWDGAPEQTSVGPVADVDGSLGGKYFTINSTGDATGYYVWMSHTGRAEFTNITAIADVAGALGGKYFTINSAGDTTNYYVWMNHPGRAEVFTIGTIADSGGSLGGKYLTLNSAGDTTNYYCWLDHAATAGFATAVNGSITGATASAIGAATYDFDVTIDGGGLQTLSVVLAGGETYSAIAGLMSTAVVGGSVAYDDTLFGFVVTSGTTGASSAATVAAGTLGSGGGDLFAALNAADTVTHTFPAPTAGIAAPTDPAPGALTGITATIAVNDTAAAVATAVASAINGNADFGAPAPGGTTVTVTNAAVGASTDAADVDTGFTVGVTTQGVAAAVDPAPGGLTAIPATIAVDDSAANVGAALRLAVGGSADFSTEGLGATCDVTHAAVGAATDAADVDTGFTIGVSTQGLDAATDPAPGGTGIPVSYSIGSSAAAVGGAIQTAVDANGDFSATGATPVLIDTATKGGPTTNSADVDTGFTVSTTQEGEAASVDPAPGGLTAITIPLGDVSPSDAEIGAATRSAIAGSADFGTEGAGVTVEITNAAVGATTDAADVDTGLVLTVINQGVDAGGDIVPVTAICVQPGNRIGFRSQEDFLTFSVGNGSGGIVGPGGIIPGERASTPKRVADQGRDLSLGHFAGTPRDPDLTP